MRTIKRLRRFYVAEVSQPHPLSPVLKEQKSLLPLGSAFAQRHYTRRVDRIRIEGASPSMRMRSRFPLRPGLSAMDGVSIEVLDETIIYQACVIAGSPVFQRAGGRRSIRARSNDQRTTIEIQQNFDALGGFLAGFHLARST